MVDKDEDKVIDLIITKNYRTLLDRQREHKPIRASICLRVAKRFSESNDTSIFDVDLLKDV